MAIEVSSVLISKLTFFIRIIVILFIGLFIMGLIIFILKNRMRKKRLKNEKKITRKEKSDFDKWKEMEKEMKELGF